MPGRATGFLQVRKKRCCALNLCKSVQPVSSIVKTETSLQEIHRIPHGKCNNGLKMATCALEYNQECCEALAESVKPPIKDCDSPF